MTGRGFSRPVRRRTAFGNALQALRRTRVRAIVAEIVASVTQMLLARETEAESETEGSEPPMYNDEELVDEYLRGQERAYEAGYNDGAANGSD